MNNSHIKRDKNTWVIGPKGLVVTPKDIRDKAGLVEGAEVTVELRGKEVVLKRSFQPAKSYLELSYTATYSEKVKAKVDIKKIIEEEALDRNGLR